MTGRRPPAIFSLADTDKFVAMLGEAGFSEARVEQVTHAWTSPTADALIEIFVISAPPARAFFERIGPENQARVEDAMRDILSQRFGDGPVALSNTANIAVVRK